MRRSSARWDSKSRAEMQDKVVLHRLSNLFNLPPQHMLLHAHGFISSTALLQTHRGPQNPASNTRCPHRAGRYHGQLSIVWQRSLARALLVRSGVGRQDKRHSYSRRHLHSRAGALLQGWDTDNDRGSCSSPEFGIPPTNAHFAFNADLRRDADTSLIVHRALTWSTTEIACDKAVVLS